MLKSTYFLFNNMISKDDLTFELIKIYGALVYLNRVE